MGITVAYRGQLADLTRVEDFEDRLVDLALELGGLVQIWRSHDQADPQRMVRGAILNLAPGLDSTSFLISPEGWLIDLADLENSESGELKCPPWCSTKTHFGSVEGHAVLIELLAALRSEFMPDLEVTDEGGYWGTRNLPELCRRRLAAQGALAGTLENLGAQNVAADHSQSLASQVENLAGRVRHVVLRPAEHAPVMFPEEEPGVEPDLKAAEELWDELFKHNRRQQERLQRSIEESLARGEDNDNVFEKAMVDLALEIPDEDDEEDDEAWQDEEDDEEPAAWGDDADDWKDDEEEDPFEADARHPLLESATDMMHQLRSIFQDAGSEFPSARHALFQGAGDAVGGLAQALSSRLSKMHVDADDYGLIVTQLKRALRGAAFARGALFSLQEMLTADQFKNLHKMLLKLEQGVHTELKRVRAGGGNDTQATREP